MSANDWVTVIGALSGFVVALATLITALKTHKAVQTSNGRTIGEIVESTNAKVDTLPVRAENDRSTDSPSPISQDVPPNG